MFLELNSLSFSQNANQIINFTMQLNIKQNFFFESFFLSDFY